MPVNRFILFMTSPLFFSMSLFVLYALFGRALFFLLSLFIFVPPFIVSLFFFPVDLFVFQISRLITLMGIYIFHSKYITL